MPIAKDKGKQINRLKAYWLGGLATAGAGADILNENGEKITGSKSDILIDVEYDDGTNEKIGVSAKACSNNAQMALTTVSVFCDMLRESGIDVSEDAMNWSMKNNRKYSRMKRIRQYISRILNHPDKLIRG